MRQCEGRIEMATKYVENTSRFNQQFRAAGTKFLVKPEQTVSMTEAEFDDHPVQFLLARGILKEVGADEGMANVVAQAEAVQAKADEGKLEVNKAGENTVKQVMMAQCAATKRNGERCGNNVSVKMDEYSEDVPYFCGTHRNENPAEYEKKDGSWVKKLVTEPEPAAEELVEPVISDEEIAEALAEAMSEEE